MTRLADTKPLVAQLVMLCALAVVVLSDVGCVDRRTYEKVKSETVEQTQALEAVRGDVRELDREIAAWQASNRREDAALSQLRATIQREEEQLPIMSRRAEDTLASLKTQVATLMNQSWHLARKIVDIRQESATLQAKVAQYKQEMERIHMPTVMPSGANRPAIIEPPPSMVPADTSATLPQIAQTTPPPVSPVPVKPGSPAPSVKADPPSANDSWIGMITGWFTKIWNWLFG
jgi:hypothetical protein